MFVPHLLRPEHSAWLWSLTSLTHPLFAFLTLCPTFHRQWEASLHGHASESVQPATGWNQHPPPQACAPETPACCTREGQGASLLLVAGEGHSHQALSIWAVNRYRDSDRLRETGLGVHHPFSIEYKNFPFYFLRSFL